MSNEVSNTRLYLGNLPPNATKADIEAHFATHGTGEITEVKLMHGFGFIEYKDPMDARDVVPAKNPSQQVPSLTILKTDLTLKEPVSPSSLRVVLVPVIRQGTAAAAAATTIEPLHGPDEPYTE
ncbi:Pre-mRNA-splicing factor srp2 [Beauveria bassiana]|uniref:Pre-mRNA-splicing factor srp2 n=1 Tax=Beauveria bassiana TaxID=176275 RepID=A0A2N6NXU2_BEABA|nr:Pre-mRNA-splicing factor srp2 [Beauveria bassiana]